MKWNPFRRSREKKPKSAIREWRDSVVLPEDHIVGKPLFIWLSIDSEADLLGKIRWGRLFRKIE
ncbi:MAG TPA: hypothetical protein VIL31_10385 [Cyclobacteriaceae bacterium]|jgi:hypothetical protein